MSKNEARFCPRVELVWCRYTKALDNIKTLRKERMAELKVDKERLKFLKADKDKAERVSALRSGLHLFSCDAR